MYSPDRKSSIRYTVYTKDMPEGNLARTLHEEPAHENESNHNKNVEDSQEYKDALQREREASIEARAHHFITQAESANEAVDQTLRSNRKESTWSAFAELRKHEIELNESLEMIMDQPSEEQDSPPMSKAILEVAKALSNVRQAIKTLEDGVITSVQRTASDRENVEIVSDTVTPKRFNPFLEGEIEENEFEDKEILRSTEEVQGIDPEKLVSATFDKETKLDKKSHEVEMIHHSIDREKRKELEAKKEAGKRDFEMITTEDLVDLVDTNLVELNPDKADRRRIETNTTHKAESPVAYVESTLAIPANLEQTKTAIASTHRLISEIEERLDPEKGAGIDGWKKMTEDQANLSRRNKILKERLRLIEQMKNDGDIAEEKTRIADALHLIEDLTHKISSALIDEKTFAPRNNAEALEKVLRAKKGKLEFLVKASDDLTKLLEKSGIKDPELTMSEGGFMSGLRRKLSFVTGRYSAPDEGELRKITERISNRAKTYLYQLGDREYREDASYQTDKLAQLQGETNIQKIWDTLHQEISNLHDDLDDKALEGEWSGTAKMNARKVDAEMTSSGPGKNLEVAPAAKEKKKTPPKKSKAPQTKISQKPRNKEQKDIAA